MLMFSTIVTVGAMCHGPNRPKKHVTDLRRAAINGNLQNLRSILTSAAAQHVDLDQLLRLSAGFGHLDVMECLIQNGAEDLDSALCQAAAQNQLHACKYLISKERVNPAVDLDLAVFCAAKHGCVETEFFLVTNILHPV